MSRRDKLTKLLTRLGWGDEEAKIISDQVEPYVIERELAEAKDWLAVVKYVVTQPRGHRRCFEEGQQRVADLTAELAACKREGA